MVFRLVILILFLVVENFCLGADVFTGDVIQSRRTDAFSQLTGMTEPDFVRNFVANRGRVIRYVNEGGVRDCWIKNVLTERSWFAGSFVDPSLQELTEVLAESAPKKKRPKKKKNIGRFNAVVGYNTMALPLKRRALVDVTALQADPVNAHAVFQVASRHNCLEGSGEDITSYTRAHAQGELAAASAMPGTILRRYGLPEIDLLRDLEEPVFRLQGRGAIKTLSFRAANLATLRRAADFNMDDVRVGVHLDSHVTFGQVCDHNNHNICFDRDQHIIQIYTAAVDMGFNRAGFFGRQEALCVEEIAKKMLIASYRGTILAAAHYGEQISVLKRDRQQVFLTLMGCGVFQNKLEWVAEALEECVDDIINNNLDVTLIFFDAADQRLEGVDEFLNRLRAMIDGTNGVLTEIR